MTPQAIVALVLQIISLAPTLLQAAAAVKELGNMIENGQTPTDADVAILLEKAKAQSETIQGIAAADAASDTLPVEPDPQP